MRERDAAFDEIDRLNAHCDRYEDAMFKEREAAEVRIQKIVSQLSPVTELKIRVGTLYAENEELRGKIEALEDEGVTMRAKVKGLEEELAETEAMLRNERIGL